MSARRSSAACWTRPDAVLSLREPLLLRTLADAHDALGRPDSLLGAPQFEALLDMTLRLWSRGYAGTRAVVVKATSSAGRLAPAILARAPASRAVYLNLRAEPYLATLLGGANSATDLRGHGPGRMRRLLAGRELPVEPLHALSPGELAALGWLAESLARRQAIADHGCARAGARFRRIPRRRRRPARTRRRPLRARRGRRHDRGGSRGPGAAPVFQGPAAAVSRPGNATARLEESRRENRAEIAKGLAWLERLGRADSAIASLPRRGAQMSAGAAADLGLAAGLEQAGRHAEAEVRLPQVHRRPAAGCRRALQLRLFPAPPRPARRGARGAPGGTRPRDREARGSPLQHGGDPDRTAAGRGREDAARARAGGEPRPHTGAVQPRAALRGVRRPAARPGPVPAGPRAESRLARRARAHRPCRDGPAMPTATS